MSYVGKWVDIQCFKHDGKLHRIWDRGCVVYDDDDYIAIAAKRANVVENNGRKWYTKEPAVTVFSKKEWFNVICMLKKDFGITYYCNIASPCIIDKQTIKYIDYDLDLKLYPNNEIRVLDEREYKENKKKYHYSDELDEVIRYELKKAKDSMKLRAFPYNDDTIMELYEFYLDIIDRAKK